MLYAILAFSVKSNLAQKKWQDISSVEDVIKSYPKEIDKIFTKLNLDYPGLEKVKAEYDKNNVAAACQNLLAYYKNGNTANYLRIEQPLVATQREAPADSILENIFVIQ